MSLSFSHVGMKWANFRLQNYTAMYRLQKSPFNKKIVLSYSIKTSNEAGVRRAKYYLHMNLFIVDMMFTRSDCNWLEPEIGILLLLRITSP